MAPWSATYPGHSTLRLISASKGPTCDGWTAAWFGHRTLPFWDSSRSRTGGTSCWLAPPRRSFWRYPDFAANIFSDASTPHAIGVGLANVAPCDFTALQVRVLGRIARPGGIKRTLRAI